MQPKIGVYVCECGINISATVDVAEVVKFASGLPNVTVARDYKYMCSEPGQEMIQQDIRELGINRVEAGLNPYYFEMANIREHDSWITKDVEKATEKAKHLVSAAVSRVAWQEALESRQEPVTQAALVVGGGIAGIQAALTIARSGFQVYLVEREPSIGGHMAQLDKTFPTLDCST
jgi:heterodisulfide reductase subunit A